MYCTIMGDIINSRKIAPENQESYMKVFKETMELINVDYRAEIFIPFKVIRGDAFEGVLYSQYYALDIILKIIRELYTARKIRIRVSAVTSELTITDIISDNAYGPGFQKAEEELTNLKEAYKHLEKKQEPSAKDNTQSQPPRKAPPWFQISIKSDSVCVPLVDSIMLLLAALTQSWSEKQTEVVWAMQELSSQQLVSQRLGVTSVVVSKQLKAAHYNEYINAIESFKKYVALFEESVIKNDYVSDYTLYYSIGRRYSRSLDYEQACFYMAKALDIVTQQDIKPAFLIPVMNCLAEAYIEYSGLLTGRIKSDTLSKSKVLIDMSKQIQQNCQIIEFDNIQTKILEGNYYFETEEWDISLNCFHDALEVAENNYRTPNHLFDACYTGLANVYSRKGNYATARQYYLQSLSYAQAQQLVDPLGYADSLYNIGVLYEKTQEYQKSIDALSKAHDIYLPLIGKRNRLIKEIKEKIISLQEASGTLTVLHD